MPVRAFRAAIGSMFLLLVAIGPGTGVARAQTRQAVVKIVSFSAEGVNQGEAGTIERMVASHIAEFRIFRVIDNQGHELALQETEIALASGSDAGLVTLPSADFILSGSLSHIGDLYVLTLKNVKVVTGETMSVSDTATSLNDIAIGSRLLTRSLFGKADVASEDASRIAVEAVPGGALPAGSGQSDISPSPTLTALAGTWRGDKGIETVRIFPNGTGLAILSGGGTLKLSVRTDGPMVDIVQDQPNDPLMYRGPNINFELATLIAESARPMRWIFNLSANGALLRGIKQSVAIQGDGSSIQVDNQYEREAVWQRLGRF
ncbi:MAG: hypothetical protein E4H20_01825 [Spirochaetales bacterium]|nr:MAG: hypothetical protein E4H20_01825 [Spirochaetales bacterium]